MTGADIIKALSYIEDDLIADGDGGPAETVKSNANGGVKAPKPKKPNGGG